jgi:hypothetical protein
VTVLFEVTEREDALAAALVQASEVVVGVGQPWVRGQRLVVGGEGVRVATHVVQGHRQVEGGDAVRGFELEGGAVMCFGSQESPSGVLKPAQVDVCVRMARALPENVGVQRGRAGGVHVFQRQRLLKADVHVRPGPRPQGMHRRTANVSSLELEHALAGLGLPSLGAIPGHHPLALGVQRDAGGGGSRWKLGTEAPKGGADATRRHLAVGEAFGGAEEHQVPEGEGPSVGRAMRGEKSPGDEGAHPCFADAQQCRGVRHRVGALSGRVSHQAKSTSGG